MADQNPMDGTPRFWQLPAQLDGDSGAVPPAAREFTPESAQPPAPPADGMSRRRFLSLLGATAALAAGTVGCGRNIDRGEIVPYTRRPEQGLPGRAVWYATSWAEACHAYPLLVKTREARPILVEGNDRHGDTLGAAPVRAQAELLALYDPERLQVPRQGGQAAAWPAAEQALREALATAAVLVLPAVQSPSRLALLDRLRQTRPGLRVVSWEAAAPHGALAAGRRLLGAQLLPSLNLDKARVILTLEAELFSGEGDVLRQMRGFAAGRRLASSADADPATMNRLWAAESRMTLTGGKADIRLPLRATRLAALGFALARRLSELGLPGAVPAGAGRLADLAAREGLDPALLEALARDLAGARGAAMVAAGAATDEEVHAAAMVLNRMLGAEGATLDYRPAALAPLATPSEMAALAGELSRGGMGLVLWETNPAYDAPGDWAAAIAACPRSVSLGRRLDESASACRWQLPIHHWLEAWGDQAGGLLQQPVVAPLYDTRQAEDLLLGALRAAGQDLAPDAESWLKETWRAEWSRQGGPLTFAAFWHSALHDGFVPGRTLAVPAGAFAAGPDARAAAPTAGEGLELVLHADRRLFDGRGANIGWLQELPDPVTKCVWGNPLAVSPADARRLGLKDGDVVRLGTAPALEATVLVQPGQREGTLSLALGYGRGGNVAEGVGVNAFPLLAGGRFVVPGVALEPTGRRASTHTTQPHQLMEGRDIVRSLPVADYAAGATGAPAHGGQGGGHGAAPLPTGHDHGLKMKEAVPLTLYPDHVYRGLKWGMAIDLTACVGCAGCVVACQAENNIPVVGPERIDEGREMQWLRIDRYYEGGEENPDLVFQPMLCQHCDHAPCENVCPVAATTHNEEGLNQMTYNRCVGTRYCANNCPYKVRHFNYFDYTGELAAVLQLAANPEVSIRPRGVMEKCTFCVQRINEAKSRARTEERALADGEVRPACAVACAAGAITFGDLNSPDSAVARLAAADRRYKVLEEVGVRPAVTYLAEVRNPIPAGGAHES